MLKALMWMRLATLMVLPALGTWGVIVTSGPGTVAEQLLRALVAFLVTAAPAIMFLGFTIGIFSFPTHPLKALATVFLTPALLAAGTIVMGWGPWLFFVDECFAELGGMAIGCAAAAIPYGGSNIRVRIAGAVVFVGAGIAALYFYGSPMFAERNVDPIWVGLNAVALVWSVQVNYRIFSYYGLQRRDESQPLTPAQQRKLASLAGTQAEASTITPAEGAGKPLILLGLLAWMASMPAAAVWGASADGSEAKKDREERGERKREARDEADAEEQEAAEPATDERPRRKGRRGGRRRAR